MESAGDYEGKNCVVFGASSLAGKAIGRYLAQHGVNLCLLDLVPFKRDGLVEEVQGSGFDAKTIHKTVESGDEGDFEKVLGEAVEALGGIDYLFCAYYLEEGAASRPDDLNLDSWDQMLQDWVMNYFLVTRAAFPYMTHGGKVVFVNTTTGYTGEGEGEGEVTASGSIHEAACSSAVTGMMTSIARDIIPQGVSVNGIALGPNYMDDMERVIWATDFWLSGMCEYVCGQIIRLY